MDKPPIDASEALPASLSDAPKGNSGKEVEGTAASTSPPKEGKAIPRDELT